MAYKYKVVPFMGAAKAGKTGASAVAGQLESIINAESAKGWEYVQTAAVNIEVSPGCLGRLMGRDSDYIRYDQVVFRSSE